MKRETMTNKDIGSPVDSLFEKVVSILDEARSNVLRSINSNMVTAYWLIGKAIVEEIQGGAERAEYGKKVVKDLSMKLNKKYGRGFSAANTWLFRQFFLTYQNRIDIKVDPMGRELLVDQKLDPMGRESEKGFDPRLSWSHYRALMRVDKVEAREFYEKEAVICGWNKRELERQIHSFYYERILTSKDKKLMLLKGRKNKNNLEVVNIIKSPYVLDFLNLPDLKQFHESDLEQAIIDNLQSFILELGKGFAFVARQKRIQTETKHFYIDLVFYNYHLKCFVLIDLKKGELTHQDVGQMDMYVRMFDDLEKEDNDNPTVGIILCSEKDSTIVKYSVMNDNEKLFASKYMPYLPTEEELKKELEKELTKK